MTNKYFLEIYIAPSWQYLKMGKCDVFNTLDDLMIKSNKYIHDLIELKDITKWEFSIYRIESIESDGMKNKKIFEFRSFAMVEEIDEDGYSDRYETFKPNYSVFDGITSYENEIILKHWNEKEIKAIYEKNKKRV